MMQFIHYYGRFQDVKGRFGGLPGWAKWPIAIAAIPGVILALLSIAAFLVSILALLLLTVPTYRLMQLLTGTGVRNENANAEEVVMQQPSSGRRHIDVKIVD
ncbi:hypothetical protein BH10PLA1_BH10PLA1_22350 [soil metagenome]